MLTKSEIRKEVLKKRDDIPNQIRINKSELICNVLKQIVHEKNIKIIHIYYPIKSEVDILPFIDFCININIKLAIMSINTNKEIKNYEISKNTIFFKTHYGIYEPKEKIPFDIDILELIIVPLVAFDINKNRIGYGGGFYDRFFELVNKNNKNCLKIGVAFEEQFVDNIPIQKFDIPLNYIITENRIL